MRNPVEESQRSAVILASIARQAICKANLPKGAEDRDPFTELQIGGDHCPAGHASRAREGMMTQSNGVSCRMIFPAFPSACSLIRALIRSTLAGSACEHAREGR